MSLTLASRLARREVRRRPGRTSLVALLVTLPSLAFAFVFTMDETSNLDSEQSFRRQYGNADIAIVSPVTEVAARHVLEPIYGRDLRLVPNTYSFVAVRLDDSSLPRDKRSRMVELRTIDPSDPLTAPLVEMQGGHGANASDEVVLSTALARTWDVTTGDTLRFEWPTATVSVSGIARVRNNYGFVGMLVNSDNTLLTAGASPFGEATTWLVDTPGPASYTDLPSTGGPLPEIGTTEQAPEPASDSDKAAEMWSMMEFVDGSAWSRQFGGASNVRLPWNSVAVILGFAVLSVLIAAAFATSARRQMVTIGQLSANGAPGAVVRTSLSLQGLWSGVVGVTVSAGLLGLFLATGHGLAETLAGNDLASWDLPVGELILVALVAIGASTGAAYLPARAAARTSVLTALAGRRTEASSSRRLLPVGLLLLSAGTGLEFLTAVGALSDSSGSNANVYVVTGALGALMILAGICSLGPVIVAALGPIASRAHGAWRLTSRTLARNRARSAAVVTSIAVFVAIGLAVATTYVSTELQDNIELDSLPGNTVVTWRLSCPYFGNGESFVPRTEDWCLLADDDPEEARRITSVLESPSVTPIRWATFSPDPSVTAYNADSRVIVDPGAVTVADDGVLDLLQLSTEARARLADAGALWVVSPGYYRLLSDSGDQEDYLGPAYDPVTDTVAVTLAARGTSGLRLTAALSVGTGWPAGQVIVTEAAARTLGLDIVTRGAIYRQATTLSDYQHAELQIVDYYLSTLNQTPTAGADRVSFSQISKPQIDTRVDSRLIEAAIVGGLLLLTLLITAIGLSLMAAEGRDERDVLVSIGAPPRTLGSLAGQRAFLLSAFGVALAVPTGLIPTWIIWNASTDEFGPPLAMPWVTLALLAAVPLVAYVVARSASAVARLVRPLRMSTFAFD